MTNEEEKEQQTRGWVPKDATLPTSPANMMVNLSPPSGNTASRVECPHCHFKFNYEFIPGVSFYSIRLGTHRLFRCPNCKELHTFKITNFHSDPSLPTYGDNSETGIGIKIWVLLLGPLLALITIGVILPELGFTNIILIISPTIVGVAWTFIYIVYLYLKSRPNKNSSFREAE